MTAEADTVLVPEAVLTQFCAACLEAATSWVCCPSICSRTSTLTARMDKAVREIRGVRPASGIERVFLPGERERIALAWRREAGIPIGAGVLAELNALGALYGQRLQLA